MIFTNQLKARARVMRPTSSDGSSLPVYAELLDEAGGPLAFPCKVEETTSRSQDTQKSEQTADATMLFILGQAPELHLSDLLVIEKGDGYSFQRKYRILKLESNRVLGGTSRISRATLSKTTIKTPEIKAHGE